MHGWARATSDVFSSCDYYITCTFNGKRRSPCWFWRTYLKEVFPFCCHLKLKNEDIIFDVQAVSSAEMHTGVLQSFLHHLYFRCACRYVYLVFDYAFRLKIRITCLISKGRLIPAGMWIWQRFQLVSHQQMVSMAGGRERESQFYTLQKIAFCCIPHIVRNKLFSYLKKTTTTLPFYGKTSWALCILFHMKAVLPSFVAAWLQRQDL